MPGFVEIVARTFGRMPSRSLPPDEAVALGAAVQAALREGDDAVADMVVTDVAPFSLGIASASEFGTRMATGIFSPIIDRGTVIPVSRAEVFRTMEHWQTEIRVEVYQGEHSLCKDNTKLGEFMVRDLPRRPAGEATIEVRFTYDLNGLLEVEGTVVGTSQSNSLVIERNPGALTAKQIEQARQQMKRLKFHPRESLPNRTALARADALYAELVGEPRQVLGAAIAALRGALESQDPLVIEAERERLVALTASLSKR